MKSEDILPDRQDRIHLGGVEIRKGSVGAFIANARLMLEEELPAAQRRQAEEDLRALLPATFGYQAPFSLILRRGRSREPLIQAFRAAYGAPGDALLPGEPLTVHVTSKTALAQLQSALQVRDLASTLAGAPPEPAESK